MQLRLTLLLLFVWIALPGGRADASDLALVGAKIYPSPTEKAIENGSILLHDGRIVAVGPRSAIKVPRAAEVLDCTGLAITAGFWNNHVHLMMPEILHAETLPAQQIAAHLETMLTHWGFTTVFDIASPIQNTLTIRRRVDSGEVKGPRILTVGDPVFAKGQTPFYVTDWLKANHLEMAEVDTNAEAVAQVRREIGEGTNGVKIFTGAIERDGVLIMPPSLVKAVAGEAHREGKPVFAHPSNEAGIEDALQGGVDILAHTTTDHPWSAALVAQLKAANMGLIPTLTLWHTASEKISDEEFTKMMDAVVLPQLRDYLHAGGQILFGTDAGFMQHFDTGEEFHWMSRAGMSFPQILASLTTNPAQRFGYSSRRGRIAKGMDGDLTVLQADPAQDVLALAKVRYTIVGGKVIYASGGAKE